ncbi:MAG: HDIG domain-containing protein [candidate division Zixibacteria bacterium]|nr:HDIG domain-containing protein [Candidatus Tariuqbacter arcticus]
MITRPEALKLVKKNVKNKNLVKHMIAVEGIMRRLARHFNEDEELWGVTGMLHDLDYDLTVDDFSRHGLVTAELLQGIDVPPELIRAIKTHPGHLPAESLMEKSLYAADPISGLIVAAALMHPSKKISGLDADFLNRRFKEKRFAAGADREQIRACSEMGLELEEFFRLSIEGMTQVADELGL